MAEEALVAAAASNGGGEAKADNVPVLSDIVDPIVKVSSEVREHYKMMYDVAKDILGDLKQFHIVEGKEITNIVAMDDTIKDIVYNKISQYFDEIDDFFYYVSSTCREEGILRVMKFKQDLNSNSPNFSEMRPPFVQQLQRSLGRAVEIEKELTKSAASVTAASQQAIGDAKTFAEAAKDKKVAVQAGGGTGTAVAGALCILFAPFTLGASAVVGAGAIAGGAAGTAISAKKYAKIQEKFETFEKNLKAIHSIIEKLDAIFARLHQVTMSISHAVDDLQCNIDKEDIPMTLDNLNLMKKRLINFHKATLKARKNDLMSIKKGVKNLEKQLSTAGTLDKENQEDKKEENQKDKKEDKKGKKK